MTLGTLEKHENEMKDDQAIKGGFAGLNGTGERWLSPHCGICDIASWLTTGPAGNCKSHPVQRWIQAFSMASRIMAQGRRWKTRERYSGLLLGSSTYGKQRRREVDQALADLQDPLLRSRAQQAAPQACDTSCTVDP